MNIKNKQAKSWSLTLWRFWRWHPKIALRYLPIVEEIKKINPPLNILEVGSGSLGISPYLGQNVTGVDVDFSGPTLPYLKQVIADASNLPFRDDEFEIVLSVDMLEHLSPSLRKKAIREMLRVGKKEVCLGVPSGREAEYQDKRLDQDYRRIFGKSYRFLSEQTNYGLPTESGITQMIREAAAGIGKTYDLRIEKNLNISVRYVLMKGWMTKNGIVDILFRKVFLLFIPLLKHCNWEPTYRKIFFVKLHPKTL